MNNWDDVIMNRTEGVVFYVNMREVFHKAVSLFKNVVHAMTQFENL